MIKTEIAIMKALTNRYKAEILAAKANIEVYMMSPVGIGEHSDIVSAVDCEVEKLGRAQEKLDVLEKHYEDLSYES